MAHKPQLQDHFCEEPEPGLSPCFPDGGRLHPGLYIFPPQIVKIARRSGVKGQATCDLQHRIISHASHTRTGNQHIRTAEQSSKKWSTLQQCIAKSVAHVKRPMMFHDAVLAGLVANQVRHL